MLYAIVVRTNYPFDDPAFMLELVDEGIHIATLLGDSSAVGAFVSLRGWVAGTDGDWATTLRTAVTGVEQQLDTNLAPWPGIFAGAAIALAQLGDYESAAVLRRFAETHMFLTLGMGTTDFSREFQSIPALLIEHLGAERHAELVAQGSALNGNEAAAYLRAAADKMA